MKLADFEQALRNRNPQLRQPEEATISIKIGTFFGAVRQAYAEGEAEGENRLKTHTLERFNRTVGLA